MNRQGVPVKRERNGVGAQKRHRHPRRGVDRPLEHAGGVGRPRQERAVLPPAGKGVGVGQIAVVVGLKRQPEVRQQNHFAHRPRDVQAVKHDRVERQRDRRIGHVARVGWQKHVHHVLVRHVDHPVGKRFAERGVGAHAKRGGAKIKVGRALGQRCLGRKASDKQHQEEWKMFHEGNLEGKLRKRPVRCLGMPTGDCQQVGHPHSRLDGHARLARRPVLRTARGQHTWPMLDRSKSRSAMVTLWSLLRSPGQPLVGGNSNSMLSDTPSPSVSLLNGSEL